MKNVPSTESSEVSPNTPSRLRAVLPGGMPGEATALPFESPESPGGVQNSVASHSAHASPDAVTPRDPVAGPSESRGQTLPKCDWDALVARGAHNPLPRWKQKEILKWLVEAEAAIDALGVAEPFVLPRRPRAPRRTRTALDLEVRNGHPPRLIEVQVPL